MIARIKGEYKIRPYVRRICRHYDPPVRFCGKGTEDMRSHAGAWEPGGQKNRFSLFDLQYQEDTTLKRLHLKLNT